MDPERVVSELAQRARAGKKQPAAVMAVHILGHPAELEAIADACEKYGVPLIEDAAEALGARYTRGRFEGKHVGSIGKLGCYSFNGNKIITTGGGGMIVTSDAALAKRAKHLTTQARLPGPEYVHDEVGYNYRLTNLAAALGVAQLEQLPGFIDRKRAIAARYDAALAEAFDLPPRADWALATFWLYTIRLRPERGRTRQDALAKLQDAGIQSRPIWTPLHRMKPYEAAPRIGGEVAEQLFANALSIPSSVQMTDADQDRVIRALLAL
jgi:dTDP-4-amino-4,6-dideoxygalactose transaminase